MQKKRHTTTVTTKLNVREALSNATLGVLTCEEERLIRMRHGVDVAPDAVLELKGQAHPEARAKLAFIEQEALKVLVPSVDEPTGEAASNSTRAHIVARLRKEGQTS